MKFLWVQFSAIGDFALRLQDIVADALLLISTLFVFCRITKDKNKYLDDKRLDKCTENFA